ncbi:VOC family protein [Streptomyces sp. NPDC004376]
MTLRTGHTGLNVTDLDRSLAFYRDTLGLVPLAESERDGRRYAFLGSGGGGEGEAPVLTLWQQADGPYDSGRAGLHHLAFEAESMDRVREYESALRAAGAEFAQASVTAHREGAASGGIFFHDPDGTRLEIYAEKGAEDAPAPDDSAPACGFF